MGIMNQSQAMQFMKGGTSNMKGVPENCIILNDGTLSVKIASPTAIRLLVSKNTYLRNIRLQGGIFGTDTGTETDMC